MLCNLSKHALDRQLRSPPRAQAWVVLSLTYEVWTHNVWAVAAGFRCGKFRGWVAKTVDS